MVFSLTYHTRNFENKLGDEGFAFVAQVPKMQRMSTAGIPSESRTITNMKNDPSIKMSRFSWLTYTSLLEPILAPNPRTEIFGGSPPTRPTELLRRVLVFGWKDFLMLKMIQLDL
jgi:hypothetical protein